MISIIFLIVGILIGVGGILAYQKYFAVEPVATVSPTPTPTPDPTADWETFTSRYEYQVKYPADWSLSSAEGKSVETTDFPTYIRLGNSYPLNYLSLSPLTLQELERRKTQAKNWKLENSKTSDIPINGQGAWMIEGDVVWPSNGMLYRQKYILIENGNSKTEYDAVELIWFDTPDQREGKTFDQILSTFKFIN